MQVLSWDSDGRNQNLKCRQSQDEEVSQCNLIAINLSTLTLQSRSIPTVVAGVNVMMQEVNALHTMVEGKQKV